MRLCIAEDFRALSGGEIRLPVDHHDVDGAELVAVEFLYLILVCHFKNSFIFFIV